MTLNDTKTLIEPHVDGRQAGVLIVVAMRQSQTTAFHPTAHEAIRQCIDPGLRFCSWPTCDAGTSLRHLRVQSPDSGVLSQHGSTRPTLGTSPNTLIPACRHQPPASHGPAHCPVAPLQCPVTRRMNTAKPATYRNTLIPACRHQPSASQGPAQCPVARLQRPVTRRSTRPTQEHPPRGQNPTRVLASHGAFKCFHCFACPGCVPTCHERARTPL